MSALTTPFIYSHGTISGTSDLVNVEQVQTISRTTVTASAAINSKPTFAIEFHMTATMNPMTTSWLFATEADRDDAYDSIVALVADPVS